MEKILERLTTRKSSTKPTSSPKPKFDISELFIQAAITNGFDYDPDEKYKNTLRNAANSKFQTEAIVEALKNFTPPDKKLSITTIDSSSQFEENEEGQEKIPKQRVLIQFSHKDCLNHIQEEIIKRSPPSEFEQHLLDSKLEFTATDDVTTIQATLNSEAGKGEETFQTYQEKLKSDSRLSDNLKITYEKDTDTLKVSLIKPWQTLRLERILTILAALKQTVAKEEAERTILALGKLSPFQEAIHTWKTGIGASEPIPFTKVDLTIQHKFKSERAVFNTALPEYTKALKEDSILQSMLSITRKGETLIISLNPGFESRTDILDTLVFLSENQPTSAPSAPSTSSGRLRDRSSPLHHLDRHNKESRREPEKKLKITEEMQAFIDEAGKMQFIKGADKDGRSTIRTEESFKDEDKDTDKDKAKQKMESLEKLLKKAGGNKTLEIITLPVPRSSPATYKIAIVSKGKQMTPEQESILALKQTLIETPTFP